MVVPSKPYTRIESRVLNSLSDGRVNPLNQSQSSLLFSNLERAYTGFSFTLCVMSENIGLYHGTTTIGIGLYHGNHDRCDFSQGQVRALVTRVKRLALFLTIAKSPMVLFFLSLSLSLSLSIRFKIFVAYLLPWD
jgi:hypothetical protein